MASSASALIFARSMLLERYLELSTGASWLVPVVIMVVAVTVVMMVVVVIMMVVVR